MPAGRSIRISKHIQEDGDAEIPVLLTQVRKDVRREFSMTFIAQNKIYKAFIV
jgi:hypothetical protein